jgi:nucleoside-diphosphate-sugar epimerase
MGSARRLVVLGSTSAYDVGNAHEYPPPWIDETAPIDMRKPRVQGEEFLRNTYGAIVLRVAGIYGPRRHPYDWIRSGRVILSDKFVNLIHVEDLDTVCLAALRHGIRGTAYNVSDGIPRTWREIGRRLYGKDLDQTPAGEQPSGKRISTAKLSSMLQDAHLSIRHQDLFGSLDALR